MAERLLARGLPAEAGSTPGRAWLRLGQRLPPRRGAGAPRSGARAGRLWVVWTGTRGFRALLSGAPFPGRTRARRAGDRWPAGRLGGRHVWPGQGRKAEKRRGHAAPPWRARPGGSAASVCWLGSAGGPAGRARRTGCRPEGELPGADVEARLPERGGRSPGRIRNAGGAGRPCHPSRGCALPARPGIGPWEGGRARARGRRGGRKTSSRSRSQLGRKDALRRTEGSWCGVQVAGGTACVEKGSGARRTGAFVRRAKRLACQEWDSNPRLQGRLRPERSALDRSAILTAGLVGRVAVRLAGTRRGASSGALGGTRGAPRQAGRRPSGVGVDGAAARGPAPTPPRLSWPDARPACPRSLARPLGPPSAGGMPALAARGGAHQECPVPRGSGSLSGSRAAAVSEAVGLACGRVGTRGGQGEAWAGSPRARERPGGRTVAAVLVSIVVSIPACHAGDRGSIPRRGGNTPFLVAAGALCRAAWPPRALRLLPPPLREAPERRQRRCPAYPPSTPSSLSPLSSPGARSPRPSEGLPWRPHGLARP